VSSDFRPVVAVTRAKNDRACLALEMYTRRARSAVGALAVTLGGVDVRVFTAGVGENQPELRTAVCRGLECLGLRLDDGLNTTCRPDTDVAEHGPGARILVVHAREDLMVARETFRLVKGIQLRIAAIEERLAGRDDVAGPSD
jgi:acetate kinase